jgi:magnesium transporter
MDHSGQNSTHPVQREFSEQSSSEREAALENIVMMTGLGRYEDVQRELENLHPADIAELLDNLEDPRIEQRVFALLPRDIAPTVLSLVSPLARDKLVEGLSDQELGEVVRGLETDDATDLLETLPEARVSRVLAEMPSVLAEEIGDLLHHPADTAGGIMQTEYVTVPRATGRTSGESHGTTGDLRSREHAAR